MDIDLAPGLLVAAPGTTCPFFDHTLVLLVEHSEDGALGFVVNRPTETPVTSLLDGDEDDDFATRLEGEVWVGGPVAPDTGWVLFDPTSGDAEDVEAVELCDRVAVSASRAFLDLLAAGRGPTRYALLLGYAGWGPGQLDDEIREGSWIPIDLDPALVFDADPEQRWLLALATLGIDPARVVGVAGGVAEA
ncbi:MAG: YqgE/AlgH family protein [Sandaracinaceae bacterium]|nr:YqgE/AlgH family protein [Sandaracinaceae bacterium]